jgi:hypothetical protein
MKHFQKIMTINKKFLCFRTGAFAIRPILISSVQDSLSVTKTPKKKSEGSFETAVKNVYNFDTGKYREESFKQFQSRWSVCIISSSLKRMEKGLYLDLA